MITTALLYLAVGYASAGTAVFLYLLAYNLSGPGRDSCRDVLTDSGMRDAWYPLIVASAVLMLLAFCMLVWPYALRGHRRDVVRHRSRRAWRDLP